MNNSPQDASARQGSSRRRVFGALLILFVLILLAVFGWPSGPRGNRYLEQARQLQVAHQEARALSSAVTAYELDPTLHEALLIAAECSASMGDYVRAVEFADRVPPDQAVLRLQADLLLGGWYHRHLYQLTLAEAAYRRALERDPESTVALAGLAQLLGVCARRFEAIEYILRLIELGEPGDLVILLAKQGTVITEPGLLEQARKVVPHDPNALLGLAWHAAEGERREEAISLLDELLKVTPDFLPAWVLLGEQYASLEKIDDLARWNSQVPREADRFPQTWISRAILAERSGQPLVATRYYLEAARRAPELRLPNVQLTRLLTSAGQPELATRFADRVQQIEALETRQNQFEMSVPFLLGLIPLYESVGRVWEAYALSQFAPEVDEDNGPLWQKATELYHRTQGMPYTLTAASANIALEVDLTSFPELQAPDGFLRSATATPVSEKIRRRDEFRDDTRASGLDFRYVNGVQGATAHRMFEFTGGGVGVLDFDRDGLPDLFLTQGRIWPPEEDNAVNKSLVDTLYRNRDGMRWQNVTDPAGISEAGFGQGVTVGDVNADGFPDLFVANIGHNALWINNGDGTFREETTSSGLHASNVWTTSVLIADLNDDLLPDIYEVNYLRGEKIFDRVCDYDGIPRQCLPFEFSGEQDRLWINDGAGQFTDQTETALGMLPTGKGLGIAAWDSEGQGRLSLLVANDTTPNFLFTPVASSAWGLLFEEQGLPAGIATNFEGKSEGCMGIALHDLDGNGFLDVHITNFYNESNTLYAGLGSGAFEDQTRAVGLYNPTLELLGFGTQFLDTNQDGTPELFVANGHVDDLSDQGKPYRMPPSLFSWNGQRFTAVPPAKLGSYFQEKWLGRAAVKLDWNLDGAEDLLVGHLEDPTSLLTNITPAEGATLTLFLIGTDSPREPIGTTVTLLLGTGQRVAQLTAGDGYQASNERCLRLGLKQGEVLKQLTLRWPSGLIQEISNPPSTGRWLIVEGRSPLQAAQGR